MENNSVIQNLKYDFNIAGGNFSQAGASSTHIKHILKQLGIEQAIIRKVSIALFEAEVNVIAHARAGVINVEILKDKIEMKVEDEGPGIEDIEKAMRPGFSTASDKVREMGFGAGMGLFNIKNNTDKLEIKSEINKGTKVYMTVNIKAE